MCLSSSPAIPAPVKAQEVKAPDQATSAETMRKNRNSSSMGGGSLLTGPAGVTTSPTGRATLLGQ